MGFEWDKDGHCEFKFSDDAGHFRFFPKHPRLPKEREHEHPSGLDFAVVTTSVAKQRAKRLAEELIAYLDANPNA